VIYAQKLLKYIWYSLDGVSLCCFSPVSPFTATLFLRRFSFLSTISSAPRGKVHTHEMADSWQKYLYVKHAAFAVDPLKSEGSVRLLDVLVKTSGKGSSPILYNIRSMFKLGSKDSQETADRLREGLKRFESNMGKDSCTDLVRGYCKTHRLFFSQLRLSTVIAEETEVVHCCDDLLPPCFSLTIRFSGLYQ
jgi:hypothetical protein